MACQQNIGKLVNQMKPFSKLYSSPNFALRASKVSQPEFRLTNYLNDEYLEKMKRNLKMRGENRNELKEVNFQKLKEDVQELIERIDILKKIKLTKDEKKFEIEQNRTYELERKVIPILLRLPNFFDEEQVPTEGYEDQVVRQSKIRRYDFKLLDAKRISYINDLRKSSILGPHCEFLLGKGAKFMLAAQRYFRKSIQERFPENIGKRMKHRHLHEVDGLDFIKSAIVEASNDYDDLNYETDTRQIDLSENNEHQQQLHLVGNCSKEGLISLLIKKTIPQKCLPVRLIQFGSTYEQNLRQVNTIFFYSIVENDFKISNNEFNIIEQLISDLYSPFNLPMRVTRTNLKRLHYNEYKRVEFDIYFPYSREWRKIAHLSHYSDHLPLRMRCTENHFMGGSLTDLSLLLDAILENHQTESGKIVIPECIENLM